MNVNVYQLLKYLIKYFDVHQVLCHSFERSFIDFSIIHLCVHNRYKAFISCVVIMI